MPNNNGFYEFDPKDLESTDINYLQGLTDLGGAYRYPEIQKRIDQIKSGNSGGNTSIGNTFNPPNQPTKVDPSQGYFDLFKNTPYANDPSFQNLIKSFVSRAVQFGANNAQPTFDQVSSYANEFASQFKDKVGRDPTSDEYGQFFKHLTNESPWMQVLPSTQVSQDVQGLLSSQFSSTVQDAATKKGQDQATAATAAGSPFDIWQQAVMKNVSDTSASLQDYQQRLFQKLQPQLMTSLQAKGLLDSGALNEAFAGAAKDLTDANTGYVADLTNQANTNIANTKYAITSSPGNTALQNTLGLPSNMTQYGQSALNNVFNSDLQRSLMQQQFGNQQSLLNQQYANQPSLLQQYGGAIVGGVAGGLAQKKW